MKGFEEHVTGTKFNCPRDLLQGLVTATSLLVCADLKTDSGIYTESLTFPWKGNKSRVPNNPMLEKRFQSTIKFYAYSFRETKNRCQMPNVPTTCSSKCFVYVTAIIRLHIFLRSSNIRYSYIHLHSSPFTGILGTHNVTTYQMAW